MSNKQRGNQLPKTTTLIPRSWNNRSKYGLKVPSKAKVAWNKGTYVMINDKRVAVKQQSI